MACFQRNLKFFCICRQITLGIADVDLILFLVSANHIKADHTAPNARLHYSNTPLFQYPMAFIYGEAYYL